MLKIFERASGAPRRYIILTGRAKNKWFLTSFSKFSQNLMNLPPLPFKFLIVFLGFWLWFSIKLKMTQKFTVKKTLIMIDQYCNGYHGVSNCNPPPSNSILPPENQRFCLGIVSYLQFLRMAFLLLIVSYLDFRNRREAPRKK